MLAANVQAAEQDTVPALLVPTDEEYSHEMSFMDAMAVFMGMDVPKNRDPIAEAEAALAFLDSLWLTCKNEQNEPVREQVTQDHRDYSTAAHTLQDMAFVPVVSAKRCTQPTQPLHASSSQQPSVQLSGLGRLPQQPLTVRTVVSTNHVTSGVQTPDEDVHSDAETCRCALVRDNDGQSDSVIREVIRLLSQQIDRCVEEEIHQDQQQPLLKHVISSVVSRTSDCHVPQIQEYIYKEQRIAAGLKARSIRAKRGSEQLLTAEYVRASAELQSSEDERRNAVVRMRHAAQEIQASLAECQKSTNADRQHIAILDLRQNVKELYKLMKNQVSLHKDRIAGKRRHNADIAKALLADGENPYEIHRQFMQTQSRNRQSIHMQRIISKGKNRILKQLLCEEHAWSRELKEAELKREHEQAFQYEMGGSAKEDKLNRYMVRRTTEKVEMLDPTGRRPMCASQVIAWAATKVSKEQPIQCRQTNSESDMTLPKVSSLLEPASAHMFHGSWAFGQFAVGGSENTQATDTCKVHRRFRSYPRCTVSLVGKHGSFPARQPNEAQKQSVIQESKDANPARCPGSTRTALFVADPTAVLFEDFESGKTHCMRIQLTNASGKRAACRALDLPANVADVLEVKLQPPGYLSAGMSCHMHVMFTPKVLGDINTQITLLTSCGKMVVPVTCLCKRATLELSETLIQFGSCVIGDSQSQTFQLQNAGALQVKYSLSGSVIAPSSGAEHGAGVLDRQCDQKVTVNSKDNSLQIGPFTFKQQQGICAGHKSVLIHAVFAPLMVGQSEAVLEVLCNPPDQHGREGQKFSVHIQGSCTDLPVKADSTVLDFKTCMVGKSYRGQIRVQNSSHTAMKAHVSAPLCAAGSFLLTPSCGFVQGLGELPFLIDFRPTTSTLEQCKDFTCEEYSSINIPISVTVPDQPFPLKIWVKAAITDHMLQFSSYDFNMGTCNINECTMCPVVIRNPTSLERTFAFTGMPSDVYVQNNPGCIPPNGSVVAKVIITPRVAGARSFCLHVQSLCLFAAKLSFTAVVIEPQLTLSHNVVKLEATAFSGIASASIMLQNHAPSQKRFAFEKLKSDELCVTPAYGCVPGCGSLRLQIDYSPTRRAIHLGMARTVNLQNPGPTAQYLEGDIPRDHQNSELRQGPSRQSYALMCYSNSTEDEVAGDPACTSLDIQACYVPPSAVLVGIGIDPHSARFVCDFGVVPVGTSKQKVVMLRNLSYHDLAFRFKPTNPFGPFEQVTASPCARAMDSALLKLQFEPRSDGVFRELLQFKAGTVLLICELCGAAEQPEWKANQQCVSADLSSLPGGGSQASMQLQNPCRFPLSCSALISHQCAHNIGNCPPLILHPSSMRAAPGGALDISVKHRPDWQGPDFEQSVNILGPSGRKEFVLHGSMLAGSLRIRGGQSSSVGIRLPPTLAPHSSRNNMTLGLVAFPTMSWGEQHSTEIKLENINPQYSGRDMRISFHHLTTEEQAMGWQVQPMELFIGCGEIQSVTVSLHLPDDGPEAFALALGLSECFTVNLVGSVLDACISPDTSYGFTLTIRSN